MFHFQHWPDHGVPKDFNKLLSLISKVEKSQQQQNESQPIVIVCRYLQFLVGSLYNLLLFRAFYQNTTIGIVGSIEAKAENLKRLGNVLHLKLVPNKFFLIEGWTKKAICKSLKPDLTLYSWKLFVFQVISVSR